MLFRNLMQKVSKKNFHLKTIWMPGGHLFPFEYPKETAECIINNLEIEA